ncbi:MAG: HAD family hydrolase [Bacillota bacterium]|nr:HAD family hydrolase [Bacillota bacterium]
MGINKEFSMVKEFHKAFNHPIAEKPTLMPLKRAEKRYKWMKEEIDEFINATKNGDIYEQVDAMIDNIYFALGTLVEIGVYPEKIFEIVQNANMSKLWEDGKPRYNKDGKVIKPNGWQDPHDLIKTEINKQRG